MLYAPWSAFLIATIINGVKAARRPMTDAGPDDANRYRFLWCWVLAYLVFSVVQLIEYYSRFYLFKPGDVITTGSPSGVGYGRNPKVFMKAGDVVEVEVPAIGVLRNSIAQ